MMAKTKVQRKPPATPTPGSPPIPAGSPLSSLAIDVESVTGPSADALRAAADLLTGASMSVTGPGGDEGLATLAARGLDAIASDLEELGKRARTAGGAA